MRIPQDNMTLNLLRSSRTNPKLSVHTFAHGKFDFRTTHMAQPGTKVPIHKHPNNRAFWDLNGEVTRCAGPSLNYYRCVQCCMPRTRSAVNSDTVEFFPHSTPFPSVKSSYFLTQAATNIISITSKPPSINVPSLQSGKDVNTAIFEIAKMLKHYQSYRR